MLEFLAGESDYVSAITGLVFALSALAVLSLRQLRLQNIAWGWLAAYLAIQSAEALLDVVLAVALPDSSLVLAGRLFFRAVSNVLLLEFCRQGYQRLGFRVPGPWVLFVPVVVVGFGATGGLTTMDAAVFLLLGSPAKILGGVLLCLVARSEFVYGRWLRSAGVVLILLVLPSLWRVVSNTVLPEVRFTPDWVPKSRVIPADLMKCLLAVVLDFSIWSFARKVRIARLPDPSFEGFRSGARVALAALIGIMVAGWLVTFYLGTVAKHEKTAQVVQLASASASTFSAELFLPLAGSVSDQDNTSWKEIQRNCQGIGDAVPQIRYVYAFGRRLSSGHLFFFVDTEPNVAAEGHGVEPTATPGDLYLDPAASLFSKVFQSGKPVSLGPYRDKWGSFISAGAPIKGPDGEVVAILGIDVDAGDWVRTVGMQRLAPILLTLALALMVATLFNGFQRRLEDQRRLAFSESSLRTVFSHVNEAIIVHDARGTIIDVNKRMLELWGLSRDQALTASIIEDLSSAETHQGSLPRIWENVMAGEEVHLEWHCRKPTAGGEFLGELFMTRMDRSDGPVIVSTVRDVTQRKSAEVQLKLAMGRAEALAERAEQANRAKSAFLANMSHEIRTPLNGVLGMTRLLLDSGISGQTREYVEIANKSGEHLLQVLNDILDFSKIEAGKLVVDQVAFDLAATIEDAAAALGMRILGNGVDFACVIHSGVPEAVQGDPVRVRQILGNLLGNASKFTQKGEIVVEVSRVDPPEGDVATVRVSVTDTGPGIPAEALDSLFQAFSQVDNTAVRQVGGTGLGLSVCRRLVELMGGRIGVDSTPGKGSMFWFEIPMRVVAEHSSSFPTVSLPNDGYVLAVIPHASTLKMVVSQLRAMGAETKAAADFEQAGVLAAAVRQGVRPIAAMVLDWDLGAEAVAAFLATLGPAQKGLPKVILVRPHESLGAAVGIGAYTQLMKPVRRMQLGRALTAAVEGIGPEQADGLKTPTKSVAVQRKSVRILVVEDNQANQKVAAGLLGHLGHHVVLAANGREALRELAAARFDLVLMDCQMPLMDGYEATRRVRFGPDEVLDRHLPVVAMTAHAFREEREKCLASGMDDHLAKPVRLEELDRMVKKWTETESTNTTPRPALLPTTEVVFDRADLEERLMADWRLIRKVAEACLREIPDHLEGLKKALDHGDQSQVVLHAHSVKGVASTLSGQKLRVLAQRAEMFGKEGKLDAAAEVAPQMQEAFVELEAVVRAFLERLKV